MTTNRVTEEPGEVKVSRPVLQGGGGWQRPSPTQPYCVSQALGMETPNSPTYLALYHIGREELKKNAQAIALGVQRILREVERASAQAAEVAA